MSKPAEIIRFYVLCNKLKDVVRTGWKIWHVQRDRLESIAEHIYGVQMLAVAMQSEYQYAIDLEKVILMLALHELEEIKIGDYNPFEISKDEKAKLGHQAVAEVLGELVDKPKLQRLVLEFDARETTEAKFAHWCDKLEADIQCKLYDEAGAADLANQPGNNLLKNSEVKAYLQKEGAWSSAWLELNKQKYHYDENFTQVSDYVKTHQISLAE